MLSFHELHGNIGLIAEISVLVSKVVVQHLPRLSGAIWIRRQSGSHIVDNSLTSANQAEAMHLLAAAREKNIHMAS